MSYEVKTAAERLRRGFDYGHCPDHWGECDDARVLAEAYLAEHHADDDEAITEDWANTLSRRQVSDETDAIWVLGIADVGRTAILLHRFSDAGDFWAMYLGDVKLQMMATRSQLRQLCAALGIELTLKSS
jgi:hypothetical protein